MKIAFTGAGGTGKTTMAKYLAEKWGLPYVGSVSRQVMEEFQISSEVAQEHMTPEQLLELQKAIGQRRFDLMAQHTSYVTDRCALDNYVYALRRCGAAMTEAQRKEWEEKAIVDLFDHDLVFYAPINVIPLVDDGTRVAEIAHQNLIDLSMYGFLCKHGFERMASHIYIMSMSDLDRRKMYCDALVSELHALGA